MNMQEIQVLAEAWVFCFCCCWFFFFRSPNPFHILLRISFFRQAHCRRHHFMNVMCSHRAIIGLFSLFCTMKYISWIHRRKALNNSIWQIFQNNHLSEERKHFWTSGQRIVFIMHSCLWSSSQWKFLFKITENGAEPLFTLVRKLRFFWPKKKNFIHWKVHVLLPHGHNDK